MQPVLAQGQVKSQPVLDSAGRSADSATLQEVVITATRSSQRRFSSPYTIDLLKQPMQEMHNARTVPEAMSYMPGVFVQKTNHGGGSPFLRGLTGNQTLLMIDGIRFNNSTFRFGPNQYPNLIDAYTVNQIEVLKGSGSVQYGSDAMGGVMHILTREQAYSGKPAWKGQATARVTSSNMDYTGRASIDYTDARVVVSAGVTYRYFGDLVGGDTTGRQDPSGYTEANWDLKTKFLLSDGLELLVAAQQVNQQEVPLYHRVALENFEYYRFQPQRMLVSYARLRGKGKHPLLSHWNTTLIYKKSQEGRSYHRNNNASYFDEMDEVKTVAMTADAQSVFNPHWSASTGVEWYLDHITSSRERTNNGTVVEVRGLYPNRARQHNASFFTLHHFTMGRWKAEAGLRYNYISNYLPGTTLQLPGSSENEAVTLTPSAWVGNLGLLYNLHDAHAFFASVSNGYRAPSIDDMGTLGLVDFRYELPAYDLQPEKSIHSEIGYRFRNPLAELEVSAYYMHIRDLISRVRNGKDSLQGYPVYVKTNDQEAVVKGIEASVVIRPVRGFELRSLLSWQHGQNLSRQEPMRRIPPLNGLATLTYRHQGFYVAGECQWASLQDRLAQGDKEDNRIPAGGTPAWQVFNIHAGYTASIWSLRCSLNNLLNEDYRTHGSGINAIGRSATLQATFRF